MTGFVPLRALLSVGLGALTWLLVVYLGPEREYACSTLFSCSRPVVPPLASLLGGAAVAAGTWVASRRLSP
jgi:hypothetical protein